MTSAKPYPSPALRAPSKATVANAFPWILFACCWLIFFLMYNKLDAPLNPALEDRVVSDVAQQSSEGDSLHKALTVILGGIGIVLCIQNRRRIRMHGFMAGLFIAYLGWICLSAVSADDPDLTFRRIGGFAFTLLLCAGCASRMSQDANALFVAGIPALNLIPDVFSELRYNGVAALSGRFAGTSPHPNVTAAALAIPVIVFAWFTYRSNGRSRTAFSLLTLASTVAFLLTRSRTSLLAVLAALGFAAVVVVIRSHRQRFVHILAVLTLAIGIGGLTLLVADTASPGGVNVLSVIKNDRDEGDPTQLTGRVDLWKTCLEYVYERPILGYGFGGFWSPKHIESISAEQKWPINQSHSAYIDQLLAIGFPGAVLHVLVVFGALGVCIVRFFRHQDQFGVWASIMVYVAFHSFTEAISLPPSYVNFVWSIIVIQLALIKPGTFEPDFVGVPHQTSSVHTAAKGTQRPPYVHPSAFHPPILEGRRPACDHD